MKTTIYLIRHAEAEKSENIIMDINESEQTFNEKIPLSKAGEYEAKALLHIKELTNIDCVYSSHYTRAISTARYISEQSNVPIIVDSRLGERIMGQTKGIDKSFWLTQMYEKESKCEDGESQSEVQMRMSLFVEEILQKDKGKTIAVFTHAVAMTFLLMKWCKLEKAELNGKKRWLTYKGKTVINDSFKTTEIFKIIFEDESAEDIQRIISQNKK